MSRIEMVTMVLAGLAVAAPGAAGAAPAGGSPAAVYAEECGSCHLAYPARFLPQASWEAGLAGLAQHFGTDASVDPATLPLLRAHLGAGARPVRPSDVRSDGSPLLAITEMRWFRHEHGWFDRHNAWKRPTIGSAANCGACHLKAEQGTFDEDDIRVPK